METTRLKYFEPVPEIVDRLTKGLGCHPLLARLLSARGITEVETAEEYLTPDLSRVTDPFLIQGMEKAVQRIYEAVTNREKILIFGDFDADGVTATALLADFLEYCGAEVAWYIPHRIDEGYSLQNFHIQMAVERDIDLIITVDCGVGSHEPVLMAAAEDIDVIVTDHHEPDNCLPEALAVIDPKRKDCPSQLEYLAGVGVAFYLAMAMRKYFRDQGFWNDLAEPNLSDYLDLFAIGTIGDMVPLINENRNLSMAGLKKIRQGKRIGIKSLAHSSRLDLKKLDSDDISFKIVPRINAAGRISHARICVSQLTSPDVITADKTAALLEQLNQKRQKIEQQIVNEIEDKITLAPELLQKKILFLWDKKWDPSVLGIAASKLSRKYSIPVVLLSCAGEYAIGSCRSINDINIHQALKSQEDLLVKFGGHAMACGLTVEKHNLETLRPRLNDFLSQHCTDKQYRQVLNIDAVLDFHEINYGLAKEIDRMRPFGVANPEPVFLCKSACVFSSFLIGGLHRKMILGSRQSPASDYVEAFHFNVKNPDQLPDFFEQLAFKLKINKFKHHAAQMIIEEI